MKRAILALMCGGGLCAFAANFPVKPRACYETTFRARVGQGPNVEDSPQLADVVPICACRASVLGVKFAAVQWRFADTAGKTIPRPREGASPQTLFSREWKTFRYRFWTPEHAARFELFPVNGAKGNKAELADVALREVPPEERDALNFNGDFSVADDIPWGWQLVGSALFHNLAPGRSSVNTMDGHVNGDLFPVTPGQAVRLTATASNPIIIGSRHEQTNVRLAFYPSYASAAKKEKAHRVVDPPVSPAGTHATASHVYRVPDGMQWARISVWHGIAEKIEARVCALRRPAQKGREGGFRTAWCNVGDARSRLEPLASSLESLTSMVDELRKRESVRPDGTCYFDLSAIKPDKHRDFFLNLRSRPSNAKAFYLGKFVHDQAEYRRFLEAHPNFLGFESWEWGNDAYLPIRKPAALTKGTNPLSRSELEQVLARVKLPSSRDGFVEEILRPVFDRLREWHYNDPKRLLLGEGHYCIGHLAAYWGVGQLGIETTRDYMLWQIQMMFCRGAARQFGVPWKWYVASYLSGMENGVRRDGSYFAEPDGRPWHGPQYGISQSAVKRATYLTYLSGANWYEREDMTATHFLVKDGPPRLSDEGRMYDRFYAFTRQVDRGSPLVPFALLVPAHRGYTRKSGPAFDRYSYTRADYMLDAIMSVILDFPRNKRIENYTNHVERVMANSPYGDCFDVLTPDFPDQTAFARTIGDYRAAFLIGDYGKNGELAKILQKYVAEGGVLVLSSAQLGTFPVEASSLVPMRNAAFSSIRIGKGCAIVGHTPYLVPWDGEGVEASERALAGIRIGDPVRFPDIEWLIGDLESRFLPVKVTGDIQYGINETDNGLLVYLINNAGVVKFPDKAQQIAPGGVSVKVDFSRLGKGTVKELIERQDIASGADRVEILVPYGEIRVVRWVRQSRTSP